MMRCFKTILLLGILLFSVSFANASMPKLPNYPVLPLPKDKIVALSDTKESWESFSKQAKENAVEAFKKQKYDICASWLYSHYAAELFAGDWNKMPKEVKYEILLNLPAFLDFYETVSSSDKMEKVADVLMSIHSLYPNYFKKYIRMAYALALVYDTPPPAEWPESNTPSIPSYISEPSELFLYFTEKVEDLNFPPDKLVIGELIWMVAVGGPLDELRSVRKKSFTPYMVETTCSSIKTDKTRLTTGNQFGLWEGDRPYTLANIRKFGGAPIDKVYYAWRCANANGIPCVLFSYKNEKVLSDIGTAWLAYMVKPAVWKYDVAKDSTKAYAFHRPLNPQTWKPITIFDIKMLERRHMATLSGIESMLFLRISEILFDAGDYNNAAIFADKSKKSNIENWKAHLQFITCRARFGATNAELDAHWRKAYEAFRRYPEKCIDVLNYYRTMLAMKNDYKEGDRLFVSEMRMILKENPILAMNLFANEVISAFKKRENKDDVLAIYADILRFVTYDPSKAYELIVSPLMELFAEALNEDGMKKTYALFESATRANPISPTLAKTAKSRLAENTATIRKIIAEDAAAAEMDKKEAEKAEKELADDDDDEDTTE